MARPLGGYIGFNRTPTTAAAPGVWTLEEAQRYRRSNAWPSGSDVNFSDVTLLLHFDGTNGSTTFTDSSSLEKSVTANGNVSISSDSKFGSGSGVFDGNGDYLSVTDSGSYDFATGDFTVECWIKRTTGKTLCAGSESGDWMFATDTGSEDLGFGRNLVAWDVTSGSVTYGNGWNHVAACRSGNTLRLFLNGDIVGTNSSATQSYNVSTLWIGARAGTGNAATDFFDGKIDELRITKGVARYTAAFTVRQAPFQDY